MGSDSPNWKTLKPGDKIHIVQIPSLFDEPHYHNGDWEDIFVLYRNLISTKTVLVISEIDEDGRPERDSSRTGEPYWEPVPSRAQSRT